MERKKINTGDIRKVIVDVVIVVVKRLPVKDKEANKIIRP